MRLINNGGDNEHVESNTDNRQQGMQIPIIIFPRNASFREFYVFVSNAAAASAALQFRYQRDNV